jgi:hypothetical protein
MRDGIRPQCVQHADLKSGDVQLEEGTRVVQSGRLGVGVGRRELQRLIGRNDDVVEDRGAGAGGALPHSIPVVENRHSIAVGWYQRDHRCTVGVTRKHLGVIGVQRAGGEILPAVEPEPVAVPGESRLPGESASRCRAQFGRRVADDLAAHRQLRHPRALVTAEPESLLDVGEVPAQDVRDVHIGGRQRDDDREQLVQAGSATAVLRRYPQRSQTFLSSEIDCRERSFASALALQRTLADGRDQAGQPIRAWEVCGISPLLCGSRQVGSRSAP